MVRLCIVISVLALVSASVLGQSPQVAPRSFARPVTSPLKNGGVYHLGLGTWTRRVDATSSSAWDVVYNNTCGNNYYGGFFEHEYGGDEGRVPGPNGPVLCDQFGLSSSNIGCHCSYVISAFEIGYCTSVASNLSFRIGFQDAYTACAVPATTHGPFTLTGLPGAGVTIQGCWAVTIDLTASGQSFTLSADGASCTWGANDWPYQHLFGWTFENLNNVQNTPSDYAGPIASGNFYPPTPCSRLDGSRWDTLTCPNQGGGSAKWPNNLTEEGWGLDSQDRWRDDTTIPGGRVTLPGPGCYYFGSQDVSFHLRLFSSADCPPPPASDLCVPGLGGVLACPCSNPQVPIGSNRGCNNSANTGGAVLSSSGTASLAADSLLFTSAAELPNASSILLQGRLPASASGIQFGQGVRCITTGILRLYLHGASAGVVTFPQGTDAAVHTQSAAKGDVILAPATRLYAVYYRDPTVLGSCTPSDTFNTTQTRSLVWVP